MNEGYQHGINLLVIVDSTPLGHSKTCSYKYSSDSKDRANKEQSNTGLWKDKVVTGLNVAITAEGFCFFGDEMGFEKLEEKFLAGKPITVKYAHRGEEATKYRTGQFIITSLEQNAPADDDATYSISLENSGAVTIVTVPSGTPGE